jgi:hypothetical protein
MILAGLLLLAVGAADLVRTVFKRSPAPIRLASLGVVAVAILALGVVTAAPFAGIAAVVVGALWLQLMPDTGRSPASIWPAAAVGALAALAVVLVPADAGSGLFGPVSIASPVGALSLPAIVLTLGAVAYLMEAANVVVRAALERENIAPDPIPEERHEIVDPTAMPKLGPGQVMRGGRLIGPLERAIVFALTLAAAYPLLAAFIAAKGIVRFPEISRDGDGGDRAEYFLVGSMVSWVQALSLAFLVWFGIGAA